MKTHILFFTLISIIFALHAADDKIITLQSSDGTCIALPATVAKHSQTLANIIGDCPVNEVVSVTKFNAQELKVLADILNIIHQTTEQDAIASLYNTIYRERELEHLFAALHDFFDIRPLRQALAARFFWDFHLIKAENLLEKAAALTKVSENLWARATDENEDATARKKNAVIHRVIENMQLTDREDFLTSKGKQIGLFFIGVSVGEAAQYGLVNMNYVPDGTINNIDQVCHFEVRIFPNLSIFLYSQYLTSLEGLRCESPIDITTKKRTLWISKTYIRHLFADNFQHAQDPEILLLNDNKIASIDSNAFRGLHSLKKLNLCHNNLTHIPPKVFKPLVNLEELSLSDNKLTHIHANMFKHCTKLKTMYLLDTPIPMQEIVALRNALPSVKIYTSFNPLVASNL